MYVGIVILCIIPFGFLIEGLYKPAILFFAVNGFSVYLIIRASNLEFKIEFTETSLMVPMSRYIQDEAYKVECHQIVKCKVTWVDMSGYFLFTCKDGEERLL